MGWMPEVQEQAIAYGLPPSQEGPVSEKFPSRKK